MYAAYVVDIVGEVLLGKDFPHSFPPPMRSLVSGVPEQVSIDYRDSVKKIGRGALSNELMPMR
jgi:hypothetical protein